MLALVSRRRDVAFLLTLVLGGWGFRLLLTSRLPVGYDEVFVMAVGLLDMRESADAFWIETPVQRSSGTAPLWWWANYVPFRIAGDVSLVGLRVIPLTASLGLLGLVYGLTRRRFGRSTALWFLFLLAASDVLAFVHSRCDFFESLLLVFLFPTVCALGRVDRGVIRGLLWAAAGMTFLGKAMFVVGVLLLAEAALAVFVPKQRLARLRAAATSAIIAAVPVCCWLWIAQRHYADRPVPHEAGVAADVASLVKGLTLGYQTTKQHVTGTPLDAAQVWLDGRVWPLTAATFVPLLLATALAAKSVVRGFMRGWTKRRLASFALLVFVAASGSVIISRGTAGARFHLLYLPGAWLLIALSLTRRRLARSGRTANPGSTAADVLSRTKQPNRPPWIRAADLAVVATAVCAGLTHGWLSWGSRRWSPTRAAAWAGALGAAVVITLLILTRSGVARRHALPAAALVLAAILSSTCGPLAWAPSARFEPMYGSAELAALDAYETGTGPKPAAEQGTLEVYLTNYFLTRGDLRRAEHYGRRAVHATPKLPAAWFYLGLAYDAQDRPRAERRSVWEQALKLKPDSAAIRERLAALEAAR